MTPKHLKAAIAAATVTAFAATALAQMSLQPTDHRHKLRHLPPLLHPQPNGNIPQFGDALLGLTAEQLASFVAGREEFESVETVEGGLGPIFNNNSCAACHSAPVSGGASATTVTRFGKTTDGHFDPLANEGGSLLQQMAIDPSLQEVVPADANVVAHRVTPPLFGAGPDRGHSRRRDHDQRAATQAR